MCQMSVVVEKDGQEELLGENVTGLEVKGDGLVITTLFEGSKELQDLTIGRIDFSGGKVYLQ